MTPNDHDEPENHKGQTIVSETLITVYINETPDQEKARIKAGAQAPFFQYVAVKTK